MNHLIKKQVIDRNGKLTTVHVRDPANQNNHNMRGLSSIPPQKPSHSNVGLVDITSIAHSASTKVVDGFITWDGKPLQHQKINVDGVEWAVAPQGYSGAHCDVCKSFFTVEAIQKSKSLIQCSVCKRMHSNGQMDVGVLMADIPLFDKQNVRDQTWVHITTKAEWDKDILKGDASTHPFIHAGSENAAMMRKKYIQNIYIAKSQQDTLIKKHGLINGEQPVFYRFDLRLKDDAVIADDVLLDEDADAPLSLESPGIGQYKSSYALDGATRYVNQYEDHGSISLIMRPKVFEIVNKTVL